LPETQKQKKGPARFSLAEEDAVASQNAESKNRVEAAKPDMIELPIASRFRCRFRQRGKTIHICTVIAGTVREAAAGSKHSPASAGNSHQGVCQVAASWRLLKTVIQRKNSIELAAIRAAARKSGFATPQESGLKAAFHQFDSSLFRCARTRGSESATRFP